MLLIVINAPFLANPNDFFAANVFDIARKETFDKKYKSLSQETFLY